MVQKCSTKVALICFIACFVFLAVFLSGSTVQADGGGNGTWPEESPDPNSSTGDVESIYGIDAMIAGSNLAQLIL